MIISASEVETWGYEIQQSVHVLATDDDDIDSYQQQSEIRKGLVSVDSVVAVAASSKSAANYWIGKVLNLEDETFTLQYFATLPGHNIRYRLTKKN